MRLKRRRNRRASKKVPITVLFLTFVLIGIGYAYINSTLNIAGTTVISKNNWDIHFENLNTINGTLTDDESISISDDKTTINFNVNLETIDDYYEINADIVNSGGIDAMLNNISLTELNDSQKEYLEFYATYNNGEELKINDKLPLGDFDVISVVIKYKDGIDINSIPNTTDYLDLSITLNYGQATKVATDRGKNLVSLMKSKSTLDNTIDFSKISSDTNGKGVYTINSTKDDINPIYYYRGNVEDNNLTFGDFCWKIVRTTDSGGTKIIYNGIPNSSGICNATGNNSNAFSSNINDGKYDQAYCGYMYGQINSSTFEETHANIYESNLKKKIDNWYENNLIKYTNKLEDTIWCNERKGLVINTELTSSLAVNRVMSNNLSLTCSRQEDSFTISSKNGNGKLKYPVATITSDEIVLAGSVAIWGKENPNSDFYLNNSVGFWTMTPSTYATVYGGMNVFSLFPDGHLENYDTAYNAMVRPMISLKRGTRIISGNGTKENPYKVI